MGWFRWMAPVGAVERGRAEAEDAPVLGHEPVAVAVGCGSHAHDGLVQMQVARGAEEPGVAVGEDPPVGRHQPVASAIGGGRHADDLRGQRGPGGRPEEGLAEGEDAAVGRHHAVARRRRTLHRAAVLEGLSGVGINHQGGLVDGLEGAGRHLLELVDECARPRRISRAPEIPVRAVVGQDQAVLLHRPEDDLGLGREGRDVEARLQPETGAHRGEVGIVGRARGVARRPDEGIVRRVGRHADGVGDAARLHLVVAQEPRQDRQPGGVRRRPPAGAQRVRIEVPDRSGAGGGTRRAVVGVVELVEGARARVDHQGVTVAGRRRAAFDRRVSAKGVGTRVAFVAVLERHVRQWMRGRHDRVGDAIGVGRVTRRPEVRMQVGGGAVHAGQPRAAVGIHR